ALALLHPHCTVVAPAQAATTPAIDAAAPSGSRAGRNRSCSRVAAPCELLPLRAVAPCSGPDCSRSPLADSQAMAGRPYRGPGRGQPPLHIDSMHVAAPPPEIIYPVFQIRIEKMKEVKRPPL
ncbi:hypothetical protein B296_00056446, partial [Ensete ventricosum]